MTDLEDAYSRQPADDEKVWTWRNNKDGRTGGLTTRRIANCDGADGYSVVWWDEVTAHHYPYKAPEPVKLVEPIWRLRDGGKVLSILYSIHDDLSSDGELGLWASEIEGWPNFVEPENEWVPRAEFLRWKADQ